MTNEPTPSPTPSREYAELPDTTNNLYGYIPRTNLTPDQARAFADATHALRVAKGAAGVQPSEHVRAKRDAWQTNGELYERVYGSLAEQEKEIAERSSALAARSAQKGGER